MPKIFGSSLVAILAASIALYLTGFMVYGVLFSEQWLELVGMSEAEAMARNEELGAMMFVWGFLITLVQVVGLAWVMNHVGASNLGTSIKVAAMLAVLIVLPVLSYNWLYEGRAFGVVLMDFGHLLVGYSLACAILGFFRGKDS